MKSRNNKYALILIAAVAMTATGAISAAYAQQVSDGMPGADYSIYTGNPNECWYDTDDDGVPDMYCMIDTCLLYTSPSPRD